MAPEVVSELIKHARRKPIEHLEFILGEGICALDLRQLAPLGITISKNVVSASANVIPFPRP